MTTLLPVVAFYAGLLLPLTLWQVGAAAIERAGR